MGGSFYHPWFHCRPQNDGFFWQSPMLTLLSANFHNSLKKKSPHYQWEGLKKRLRAQKIEKKKPCTKRQCLVMKESATPTTVWTVGCCFACFSPQIAVTHPSHWKKMCPVLMHQQGGPFHGLCLFLSMMYQKAPTLGGREETYSSFPACC